jgi:hypothetical protein
MSFSDRHVSTQHHIDIQNIHRESWRHACSLLRKTPEASSFHVASNFGTTSVQTKLTTMILNMRKIYYVHVFKYAVLVL